MHCEPNSRDAKWTSITGAPPRSATGLVKNAESKSPILRISLKTKRGFHDPRFQIRCPAAAESARFHGCGSINARPGHRGERGRLRANKWGGIASDGADAAAGSGQRF